MSNKFSSDEVYMPEDDTFLLLKAAISEANANDLALEIGCGTGLVSQELLPRVRRIIATDINPHALRSAKARGLEVIQANLFSGIKGKFDLILLNPPYLPTTDKERTSNWINYALDGGANGREIVNRFLEDLPDHLKPKGRALLLISSLTGPENVNEKARASDLEAKEVASIRCFFEQLYVLKLEVRQSQ